MSALTLPGKTPSGGEYWRREITFILVLLSLCYLLFFFQLGKRPLWDIDEGMHAATSKDMVLSGDWITPTLNGEKFYDKPVLYNWLVSLSFLAFGFNEFAARLPSALLGTGSVIVTYLLGKYLFGSTVGFLSGVILAASGEHMLLSRAVVHDMALAFFITLSLFFFYKGFKNESDRRKHLVLFYVSSGFSVLAKGPVGLLLPLLIIGLFLLLRRRLPFLKDLVSPWGIILFLAIASPWHVLVTLRNRDFGSYFFIHQNLMNFLSSEARHHGPVYYYFPVLLGGFFPWSCFLPLALVLALRNKIEKSEEVLFLTVWFLAIFAFFSVASSKLVTYILPLFPAVACLVGLLWGNLIKGATPEIRRGFLYSFLLLLSGLTLVILYVWVTPFPSLKLNYGVDIDRLKYYGLPFLGAFVAPFILFLRNRLTASFFAVVAVCVATILLALLFLAPLMNPYRSTKGFALKLDRMLAPGEPLVFVRVLRDSALFYTNRKGLLLMTRKEFTDFLSSKERVFCVMRKALFESDPSWGQMGFVIDEEGHKAIISNKKSP